MLKSGDIELNFTKATLFDPEVKRHLDFKKRTVVGGIMYRDLADIDVFVLKEVLAEALRIDGL